MNTSKKNKSCIFFHEKLLKQKNAVIFALLFAGVVKLVDTLDLGSSASRHGGSSPFTRTKKPQFTLGFFLFILLSLTFMYYI